MKNILNILFIFFALSTLNNAFAQRQNMLVGINNEFYDINYQIHKHKSGSRKVLRRDFVSFHIQTQTASGEVLKSTFGTSPMVKEITVEDYPYANKGFIEEALLKLNVGDSASFYIEESMLFEALNKPRPEQVSAGEEIEYIIKVEKVEILEQVENNEKQAIFDQHKKEEKDIAKYITKHIPAAKRTYRGIWYHITEEGTGAKAIEDDVIAISFVGKFLDGKVFNSSAQMGGDFEFPVKKGFVIPAFDEFFPLITEGSKAIFITPSYLAYGDKGFGKMIPPNTPLVFEVEFKKILMRKVIIENKGKIKQEEKKKDKPMSEADRIKQIEKDARKRGLNNR